MELFKLVGTIAVNNSEANQAISDTSGKAETLSSKFQTAGGKISAFGKKLQTVGTNMTKYITVPAVAAGGAILAFATSSASAADNVDKMSQKIGISRTAYQELDFVCSQSGTSVDNLQAGMKTLTGVMDKANAGNKTAAANFEKLGVSVTNADGSLRSQEDVLFDTLSALQGVENQTEKARLATELFGRSGTELMPLLNGAAGSIDEMRQQAHELGIVLDDEAIDAGVEYTDKMDQLKRSFSAAAAEIGTQLLPYMTQLAQWLIDKGIPAFKDIASKVGELVNWFTNLDSSTQKIIGVIGLLVVAAGPVITIVSTLITIGGALVTVIGLINAPILAVIAVIGLFIAAGVLLYKNWDTIKEKAGELKDKVVEKFNALKTKAVKIFTDIKEKISEKVSALKTKVVTLFGNIKDGIVNKVNAAKTKAVETFENIKSGISGKVDALKTKVVNTFTNIKDGISEKVEAAKTKATETFEGIKTGISNKVEAVHTKVKNTFDKVKTAITKPIEDAKNKAKEIVEKIKDVFNFEWTLPKLKLPHVSVSGGKAPYGIAGKGELPSFSVEWYAKAMNNPMLMKKPTAFGINDQGQIMAGGEAGEEVVSGADTLMNMISNAVAANNGKTELLLEQLVQLTRELVNKDSNTYLDGEKITSNVNKRLGFAL